MEYSMFYNGESYDLPRYNFSIAEKIEKQEMLNRGTGLFKDKCKGMYNLIVDLLGKEETEKCIGKFNEADPNEINIAYLEIVKAYGKPVLEYNTTSAEEKIEDANIDKLAKIVNAFEKIEKMKENK